MEILLEELAAAMENEEETSETSARIEKEIATMEKKLKTWRRLQDFRKTRKTGAKTSEIELKYTANEAPELISDSWRVPTNLPTFRNSKGMEDPLEFIEKFERVCQANGIQLRRYIKLVALCLDTTDVQWIDQWVRRNGDDEDVWNDFKENFISHFQHPNAMVVWQSKIRALRMDNSGVQRYSDQFIRLALRLGWNLDGELAIYHYKAGLPRWLAEQLTTAEVA